MPLPHGHPSATTLVALLAAALGSVMAPPRGVIAQGLPADYERAQAVRTTFDGLAINIPDHLSWIEGTHILWYRVSTEGGYRFVRVDADLAKKAPAFDHARLAASLSAAVGESYTPVTLPFFRPVGTFDAVDFLAEGRTWHCSTVEYRCARVVDGAHATKSREATGNLQRESVPSPNGAWEALVRNHNVAIRRIGSSEITPLSTDGSEGDQYALETFAWSPDSRRLAAYRVRPGAERLVHYIESSPEDQVHPKYFSRPYPKPGDVLAVETPVLFDVETGAQVVVDRTLFPNAYSQTPLRWWKDSRAFSFEYNQRGHEAYRIIEVDGTTGVARAILDEQPETFFSYQTSLYRHYMENGEEIIWASERDGWRHLYLYDARTGEVKNQITRGEWVVRRVDYVDEANRQIWFRASGMYADQDPYFMHYFRVGFDGSGLTAFTEANGTHTATWSPDRAFYVDTWSRADAPPVSVLRRTSDQSVVMELERGDISALTARGWSTPEPFVAKGRDGVTDIWGLIVRPSNFDPSHRYPVIEYIYAGPGSSAVAKDFRVLHGPNILSMTAQAELGFIVVQIDGMGTGNRSRAFRDVIWQNTIDAGFPDRILWHRAVAERYASYDITRVGIYGGSTGGKNTVSGVLFFPDFYDVAVSADGCQDPRMSTLRNNEQWLGWPVGPQYAENSNVENAWRLQGELLLVVGELDPVVDPACTLQLVNALIEADKDFDFLMIPGGTHDTGGPYGERRRWDFFVEHLLGVEPPNWNAAGGG